MTEPIEGDERPVELSERGKEAARAAFVTRVFLVSATLFSVVAIILMLIIIVAIRQTQQTGSPILRAVAAGTDQAVEAARQAKTAARAAVANQQQLKDCVIPSGKCFKSGQRRTKKAVVGINEGTLRVITAALNCQADGKTGDALVRCTIQGAKP